MLIEEEYIDLLGTLYSFLLYFELM